MTNIGTSLSEDKTKKTTINSYELRAALKENEHIFDLQKKVIIEISEDITFLEKKFQSSAIIFTFNYKIDEESNEHEDLFIEWAEDEHGKMRLLATKVSIRYDENFDGDTHKESKPLIETPAVLRATCYKHLPKFVNKFAEYLFAQTPSLIPF